MDGDAQKVKRQVYKQKIVNFPKQQQMFCEMSKK
jgi:hypothetical protein